MQKSIVYILMSMITALFLSACSHTHIPDQRTWKDIAYPPQSIQLVLVKNENMDEEATANMRKALIHALQDVKISEDPASDHKLVVKVVNYNEQSEIVSTLRWVMQCMLPGSWAFHTWNTLDLHVQMMKPDGSIIEFKKFDEIRESGRDFELLRESMARRVALSVFTADALTMASVEYNQ